jgi:hypothetical protein
VSITIKLVSIPVDHQEKALEFYTEKFGFEKRADVSRGDYRWLTVTAPGGSQGIPITSFYSSDLDADYKRLVGDGVTFTRS